jgi:hypothetical protein
MKRRHALWLGLVASAACATPIPQPPPAENVDIGKIGGPDVWPATSAVPLEGEPGAAPPNSTLRITNLDDDQAPVVVEVESDGSFQATISADNFDELRFQVRVGDERLEPVDAVLDNFVLTPGPRIDCFDSALELAMGNAPLGSSTSASLVLDNACNQMAQIDAVNFRSNPPTFALLGATPTSVSAMATESVAFELTPSASGEAETVVLITVTVDGEQARYPVSLYGSGN